MSNAPENKKKKRRSLLPFILLAVIAGVAWGGFREEGWFRGETAQAVTGAPVQRGPLRVTVMQRGNLSAKNSARVVSEMEGRNSIIWLIDEGTEVNPGDLIAQLDSAELEERLVQQQITLDGARASLTKAEQELEIQKSQNASDKARAEQELENAEKDRVKYVEGDWPQLQAEAEENILTAEADFERADNDLFYTKKLFKEGFETDQQVRIDEIAKQNAQIRLDRAVRAKELLEEFDRPKEMRILDAAIEEAVREKERVQLQAQARLVDGEQEVRSARSKYELEEEQHKKLEDQFSKTKLYASAPGIVVYSKEDGGWRGDGEIIREGTEVRERQEIVSIPQAGGMVAEASLHESVIRKVKPGMPVTVRVDSIPGQEFPAKVGFVALLPDKGSRWSNPDLRVFRTSIEIIQGSPDMRPDMSCSVEILVDEIEDTLFVPVQAVFPSGGRSVCFVKGREVEVETGANTDKWMEIKSGLEEGQIVSLAPPADFVPEPAPTAESPEDAGPGDGMQRPTGGDAEGMQRPTGGGAEGTGRPGGNRQRPGGGDRQNGGQQGGGNGGD